jgi:AraC-like DNA-binding protein
MFDIFVIPAYSDNRTNSHKKGIKPTMLTLSFSSPIQAENGGLFVSPGFGRHPSRVMPSYELIFVRSGCLVMIEEERRLELGAGQSLLLFPGRNHRGAEDYAKDLSFYWIHFTLTRRRGFPSGLRIPQVATVERPERMIEIFHHFLGEQEAGSLIPVQANLLAFLLLTEAARERQRGRAPSPAGPATRAAAIIARDFRKNLRPLDVARAMRLNPDYLGRIFRRTHGHTLTEAIHRQQMREARTLLREDSRNMEEIARICGFADPRYFRRLFRRHQGISPLRYRNLHTRLHINTR